MNNQNQVILEGQATEAPVLSHENHGARFYRFILQVPRLSGQSDLLPILTPEANLEQIRPGIPLSVQGQLRSFNNRTGVGSRLILSVYARNIREGTGVSRNRILLAGTICKPPIFRRTPLGRGICDIMLAVSRPYGRADYLPVIAWGQLALETSALHVGDPLELEGRVQSRIYHKVTEDGSTEERTAYEVSMMRRPE